MKRLTEAVSAYLEENPEAGEAELIQAFGTPEACAAELLSECDPAQVAAARRRKRLLLYGAIAALVILAAVLLWLFVFRAPGSAGIPGTALLPGHGHGHGIGHH